MFLETEGALAASYQWQQLQPLSSSLLEGVARLPKQLLGAPLAYALVCAQYGTSCEGRAGAVDGVVNVARAPMLFLFISALRQIGRVLEDKTGEHQAQEAVQGRGAPTWRRQRRRNFRPVQWTIMCAAAKIWIKRVNALAAQRVVGR